MSSANKKVLPECTKNRFGGFAARPVIGAVPLPCQSAPEEHASDGVDMGHPNLRTRYPASALMMGSPSFRKDRNRELEERSSSRVWCCNGWTDTGGHPNRMQCTLGKPLATVASGEAALERTCAYKRLAVAAPAEWPVNMSVEPSSNLAREAASGSMSDFEASKNPAWHRFCCP